jgi:hypothetical protein
VALYVATAQATSNINTAAHTLEKRFGATIDVLWVQHLDARVRLTRSSDDPFIPLVERYYDPAVEDEHTKKGGTDLKYGFASCGLPLVLHHNTPNNSLFLLWVEDSATVRALFHRFSRFRRES